MFLHNSFQIIYKCDFFRSVSCYFLFWASCSSHCLAALDLGAGVEQPFDCLIVQNCQAMQSIRRSMDWTLEDNMVDGLFFCATLTGRRGSHAQFVQAGVETSKTSVEAVKPDCPPTPHSIDDPPTAPHVCCCCQMNWWDVVRRVQMSVSIWTALYLHLMDVRALSGADVLAPWHDALETVWLHCDEAQQVGCLRGLEGCPLVYDAGIQSQVARRRWCGVDEAGMSTAAPDRSILRLNGTGLVWLFAELLLQHPSLAPAWASKPPQECDAWCQLLVKWLKVSAIRERPVQRYSEVFGLRVEGHGFVV